MSPLPWRVTLVKEYARIHWQNFAKLGVMPSMKERLGDG